MLETASLILFSLALGCGMPNPSAEDPPELLSAYQLFEGDPRRQEPAAGVLPYTISTPLFSDYATKHRFVRLPEGTAARYRPEEVFDFPVGTVIAKTFSYPSAAGDGLHDLLETRILLHGKKGWVGLPYIWNDDQTEARLEITGGARSVTTSTALGDLAAGASIDYRIPNVNQCKGCHRTKDRELLPIGPRAGLLNLDFEYPRATQNQLAHWQESGALEGTPKAEPAPRWPVWDDPATGSLDQRARAWLDINCAHCHNPEGPARTSGLDLRFSQRNRTLWGVDKSPVAAGRGSGDRLVDIAPGDPDGSILLYRLESLDPGVMMPELGRSLVHTESVGLIREWIEQMPSTAGSDPESGSGAERRGGSRAAG